MIKTTAIILAGGYGRRYGSCKQFMALLGRPVISFVLRAYQTARTVDEIRLVVPPVHLEQTREILRAYRIAKADWAGSIVEGGASRQESAMNGLTSLVRQCSAPPKWVCFADANRPLVTPTMIDKVNRALERHSSVTAGAKVVETVGKSELLPNVRLVPDRGTLWELATPMAASLEVVWKAHLAAKAVGEEHPNEASMIARFTGENCHIVEFRRHDLWKITFPPDVTIAEALFRGRDL